MNFKKNTDFQNLLSQICQIIVLKNSFLKKEKEKLNKYKFHTFFT